MKHNGMYREMIENVCEIVFTSIIGHMLARKPLEEQEFRMEEYLRIQEVLRDSSAVDGKAVESVLLRLKNGVDYGVLDQIL